jgi:hypothetical protein
MTQHFYHSPNGKKIPVTEMYDIDGDETDDPFMAIYIVARAGSQIWTIEVAEGWHIQDKHGCTKQN